MNVIVVRHVHSIASLHLFNELLGLINMHQILAAALHDRIKSNHRQNSAMSDFILQGKDIETQLVDFLQVLIILLEVVRRNDASLLVQLSNALAGEVV